MKDEVKVRVLKWGIQPPDIVVGLSLSSESPRNVALFPGPPGLRIDPKTYPAPSREIHNSVFDDDWAFFPIFLGILWERS